MTIASFTGKVASGDSTTGHVTAATVVGNAIAVFLDYPLSLLHLPLPAESQQAALAVLMSVAASWAMQRFGG